MSVCVYGAHIGKTYSNISRTKDTNFNFAKLNALKFPYEINGLERNNYSAVSNMTAAVIVRQRNKKNC